MASPEWRKNMASPRRSALTGPLSARQVAADFGIKTQLARDAVATLYDAIQSGGASARAAAQRWQPLTERASPAVFSGSAAKGLMLGKWLGLSPRNWEYPPLLFALHTYYALVVKRLTAVVLSDGGGPAGLTGPAATQSASPCPGLGRLLAAELYEWCEDSSTPAVARLIESVHERLSGYGRDSAAGQDLLKHLYQGLFPRALRHELGEYYTPAWLVERMLDEVGYTGEPGRRLLDPTCGSGAFLVAAMARIRAWHARHADSAGLAGAMAAAVAGWDLNPLAVLTARANYLMALAGVLPAGEVATLEIPIHLRDAILDSPPGDDAAGAFDYVVGNPPWIAWDHLPQAYRQATRPLWEQYGLFSLSGAEARHGGGKKDLSMLMTYVAADRYLKPRGRLAFVITQTLFQTRGAGDGFRRFRLGTDGPWLRVLRVNDLVAVHPFPGTANWTSTIVLEKGLPTEYPVPYLKWLPGETRGAAAAGGRPGEFSHQACQARPIDPQQPSSPWFLLPEGWTTDLRSLIGPSDYQAHLGANSGGANGVYWVTPLESLPSGLRIRNAVQRGKHGLPCVEQVIESELVYPLLRWGDVERYRARPSGGILMVQDPHTRQGLAWQTIQQRYPQTLAYLEQFRELLQARAAYRRYQAAAPFYSMYNVGPYTMAAHKVVWRRMDRRIRAAAVELAEIAGLGCRPVVPQETCVLVAVDSAAEADYLAAVLNSAVVGFLVRAHSVAGGKSFGTPGMLDFLGLRRYDPGDSRHRELSALGEQARNAPAGGEALAAIDRRIDDLVAELRGLRGDELQAIRRMESTG